jgi:CPA2 family monovalent cation:H+ antiporter-2
VSIITTFLTPYFIKAANPTYRWVSTHVSDKWLNHLENSDRGIKVKSGKKVSMASFIGRQFKYIVIYIAIVIALIFICFWVGSLVMTGSREASWWLEIRKYPGVDPGSGSLS